MDELIARLREKTGLDVDQIKSVVAGVGEFLGDKLPGPIAGQVQKLLGADEAAGDVADEGGGMLDQAKDALGGLMGN